MKFSLQKMNKYLKIQGQASLGIINVNLNNFRQILVLCKLTQN